MKTVRMWDGVEAEDEEQVATDAASVRMTRSERSELCLHANERTNEQLKLPL